MYVQEHRWPPLSYEQAMEEYRKKYVDDGESEEQGGGSGGEGERTLKGREGGVEGGSVNLKSIRRERCKVM